MGGISIEIFYLYYFSFLEFHKYRFPKINESMLQSYQLINVSSTNYSSNIAMYTVSRFHRELDIYLNDFTSQWHFDKNLCKENVPLT